MSGIPRSSSKKPKRIRSKPAKVVKVKTEDDWIKSGHDKGLDYIETKELLINKYKDLVEEEFQLEKDESNYVTRRNAILTKLIYLLIAMTQLRNGSRISEACGSFYKFVDKGFDKKVVVKISKSEAVKYRQGKKVLTKARFRKMMFPERWVKVDLPMDDVLAILGRIRKERMMKRVLDYLRMHLNINTHSLRYATINYLINVEKLPPNIVSKYVGHSSMSTILTYTQNKNCDKIFDLKM